MPEFQPPHVTPVFSYLVSFLCRAGMDRDHVGTLPGLETVHGHQFHQAPDRYRPDRRSSLDDLSRGRDTGDVIINCYLRMGDVVADKRKLHREVAMTPQEFAVRLERAGLPGDAVRRLTGLVRNGALRRPKVCAP